MLRDQPHLHNFADYLDSLNGESERGAVLIAGAYLDDLLKDVIQAFLINNKGAKKLFTGANAPLGTFSARSAAAFALGLVSQREFEEIERIREIRNLFAHHKRISLKDDKIAAKCRQLTFSAVGPAGLDKASPKALFNSAAASILLGLTNRAAYVGAKKLEHQPWRY